MNEGRQRRVARALRAGGPEVIEIGIEDLPPPAVGEALVRVEAVGLNHAETLIRSGTYAVRLPFPYPLGGEGAGVVVATGADVSIPVGTRVCWAAAIGSCATFLTAPAAMLVPLPQTLGFEEGARLPVAGLTAAGLARVWPLRGREAVVWGAGGAVGCPRDPLARLGRAGSGLRKAGRHQRGRRPIRPRSGGRRVPGVGIRSARQSARAPLALAGAPYCSSSCSVFVPVSV